MTHPQHTPAPKSDNAGIKLVLWPDGTWCWQEDYSEQDYAHTSGDFEVIDMADMPAVKRATDEFRVVFEETGEHLDPLRAIQSGEA